MGQLVAGQPILLAYTGSTPVTLAGSALDVSSTIVYGFESGNVKSFKNGQSGFLNTKTTINPGTGFQVNPGANITLSDSVYTGFGVTTPQAPTANLNLWLKADVGLTLDTTGTTTVTAWADQSGASQNASQATKSKQPTVITSAINSLPVLSFDGTDDWLGGSVSNTGNSVTVLMVGRKTAAGNNLYGVLALATDLISDAGSDSTAIAIANTPTGFTTYRNGAVATEVALAVNTPFLVVVTYDGTNGKIEVNNTSQTFASTGNFGYTKYAVANRLNGSVVTSPVDVGEVMIYNTADSSTINAAKSYLKARWGLS